VRKLCPDTDNEFDCSEDSKVVEEHEQSQKDKMRDVVKSLVRLLGDRHPSLIGKLYNSVENMKGSSMELLAESMAGMAVLHANIGAVKAHCPALAAKSMDGC
jgi:hypothetical protein